MPIRIPNDLPAASALRSENIFVMTDTRAKTQDIRPLKILLLNLMPTKIATETQLARLLGNTPIQVELELLAQAQQAARELLEADPELIKPENAPVLARVRALFAETPDIFN